MRRVGKWSWIEAYGKSATYLKHLEVVELREKAFTAREKAARARLLASRTPDQSTLFEQEAAKLEARAAELECRMEGIAAELETPVMKRHGHAGSCCSVAKTEVAA